MSAALSYPHIERIGKEPARLQRFPRIRIAQIVMDHLAHGWSVEEICRQHPYLHAAEAHAAMAYYFDHREEIEAEIAAEIKSLGGPSSLGPSTQRSTFVLRMQAEGRL